MPPSGGPSLGQPAGWPKLLPKIHLQAPRLCDRDFGTLAATTLAFPREEERVESVAPIPVQRPDVSVPSRPPDPVVKLIELSREGPLEKVGVANLQWLPIE